MDVSNDPKNYGTINMWDQLNVGIQQWFLDDNGVIRAKATGYCIYSKGDLWHNLLFQMSSTCNSIFNSFFLKKKKVITMEDL